MPSATLQHEVSGHPRGVVVVDPLRPCCLHRFSAYLQLSSLSGLRLGLDTFSARVEGELAKLTQLIKDAGWVVGVLRVVLRGNLEVGKEVEQR